MSTDCHLNCHHKPIKTTAQEWMPKSFLQLILLVLRVKLRVADGRQNKSSSR